MVRLLQLNRQMRFCILIVMALVFGSSSIDAQSKTEEQFQKEYEARTQKEYLDRVYIPLDLSDAFKELDKKMEPKAKVGFMTLTEDEAPRKYHFVLGRWMIKNWSLDRGSRLSLYLRGKGIFRPDDMAKFITLTYHRHLHNRPLQEEVLLAELAQKYAAEKEQRAQFKTVLHTETRTRNQ